MALTEKQVEFQNSPLKGNIKEKQHFRTSESKGICSPRFPVYMKTMGKSACFRSNYNNSWTSQGEQNLCYQMISQRNKMLLRNLVTEESNMNKNLKSMTKNVEACNLAPLGADEWPSPSLILSTTACCQIYIFTTCGSGEHKNMEEYGKKTERWNLDKDIHTNAWPCDAISNKMCFQRFPHV